MITFTFKGYSILMNSLRKAGYSFANYHNYENYSRCVILRHDIDNSIEKAIRIAELENKQNVKSTYFVLLRTDFYNIASKKGLSGLARIQSLGHEIGLHFDEMAYENLNDVINAIKNEVSILSDILGYPIKVVSMHRPSKKTLEANYAIPNMVNSYGTVFFNEFKYLSDSRRRWREPILDIIHSSQYDRLHILTHPIWYNEDEKNLHDSVKSFIQEATKDRYEQMAENITNIDEILSINEIINGNNS